MAQPKRPVDQRRYRSQLERELIVGGIAILIVVGGGLIALIWGLPALLGALPVVGLVVAIELLLALILKALELLSRGPH